MNIYFVKTTVSPAASEWIAFSNFRNMEFTNFLSIEY